MPLVIVFIGILFLFLLITLFKFNGFISFILVAIGIGIAQGMQLNYICLLYTSDAADEEDV